MKHRILLLLSFTFCCLITIHGQVLEKVDFSSAIEDEIDLIFKAYDNISTPGLSVGFMENGKLIFSKSYGMADLEHDIPINNSSIFSLASVSKQFTIFGILLLEQQGKLSLDDDVRKYLPEFKDYGETITLRQLANHSSGIRSNLQLLGLAGYIADNVITKEIVDEMIYRQEELNFKPGTDFSYSNSGYVLLAEVVEKVSGMPFSQFMKVNVFEPLGMNNSFIMDDYHRIVKNRAISYELERGNYVNAPANYSYYGPTGLFTNLIDLSKWVSNFTYPIIGNSEIFDKMNSVAVLNNGQSEGYALGQMVGDFNGLSHIFHSGADAGYRAFVGRFPEQNAAVLLLSNNNTVDAQGKALEVSDVFLSSQYKANSTEESFEEKLKIIKLPSSRLEDFSGNYINRDNYVIRDIYVRNDTLIYSRQDQNGRETPLFALNENNTFQFENNESVRAVFRKIDTTASIGIIVNGEEVELYTKYNPKIYSATSLLGFEGTYYSKELDTDYILAVKNDELTISHPKMDMITLKSIELDVFLGSSWQFRSLEFERNKNEQIIGFRISSDRARNVRFLKTTHNR